MKENGLNKNSKRRFRLWVSPGMSTLVLVFVLFSAVFVVPVQGAGEDGENIDSFLKQLSEEAARSYVQPIVTAFGSNLNGGWFHRAPQAKLLGFNVEFGLAGMGTFYRDSDKHFTTSTLFRFDSEQAASLVEGLGLPQVTADALIDKISTMDFTVSMSGATAIGDPDDSLTIHFSGADVSFLDPATGQPRIVTIDSQDINLGFGGVGEISRMSFLPLAAPQLTVGTVFGTQAVFRYLPSVTFISEIGRISYFGWGIQHNPAVWLKLKLPVNLAAGFFQQTLKIGDIFEAKTTAFGVNASRQLGFGILNITPYAGLMLENSRIDVAYDFIVDDQVFPIAFKLKGQNTYRLTLGLSLRVLFINLNVDYNLGKYNSFTAGVMIAI